ncbi:unnamed protein product [Ilex paraguariensis]|uniref:Protein kinase domain-containing protein n=1 Tax=Ilex paraguariensis TaxID=185542 RepID=A0ABC8TQ63_9AQUA
MKKTSLRTSKSSVNQIKTSRQYDDSEALAKIVRSMSMKTGTNKQRMLAEEILRYGNVKVAAEVFTFRELAAATGNFNPELLIGEGGFGRIVAVKQLDRNGLQGNREFLAEVLTLGLVHHPNLVNLIGYCADGRQRILVYEYMSNGSLEDHLLGRRAIDNTRPTEEQNLIAWAQPLLKDRRKFTLMADPLLEEKYPVKALYQALAVAAMCVQEEASTRPLISDVVTALEYLAMTIDEGTDAPDA